MTAWSSPAAQGATTALVPGVICWRRARNTTAVADVVTEGMLREAKHGAPTSAVTVNTVTFQPGPILNKGRNDNVCDASAPAELGALLDNLSREGANFTLAGLTPGAQYLLQVFGCDVRLGSDDQGTWGDGQDPANTVILSCDNDAENGVYGQFATGAFTAGGTTQTVSTPGRANAYEVRALSVPVDSSPPTKPNTVFIPAHGFENDRTAGIPSVPDAGMDEQCFTRGPMVPGWRMVDILPEVTRRAMQWIGNAAKTGEPFFLYFPLTSPHSPRRYRPVATSFFGPSFESAACAQHERRLPQQSLPRHQDVVKPAAGG